MADALTRSQDNFANALTWREESVPTDITARNASTPTKRFNVYRNNVFVSLSEAIRSKFPVVERLLGTEFAGAMARVYVEKNLPISPVMLTYGATYPDFLKIFEPVAHHPYMPDVAKLEWLRIESYHAADATPLGIENLGSIAPEELGDVRFTLHPSLRLITSVYPILSIWHTNTHDEEVQVVDIHSGGQDALIIRPELEVLITPLEAGEYTFMTSLARGETLDDAATIAHETCEDFSLDQALVKLFQVGAVVGLISVK
jgi:hypothetical protein